jgi:hypothetical protein
MLNLLIPFVCAIAGFLAGQRSLKLGLCAVLTVGYLYGITRANVQGMGTYLMFDLAVLGLYAAQLFRSSWDEERARLSELRFWTVGLILWPTVLFLIFLLFPAKEPLVELVGLRANVFLLPFLLFGGRLSESEVKGVALYCAALNLGAVVLGGVEFVLGIERFYPFNETTEIIYRSRDLVGYTAHRIPASFVNAHAFAGTMAATLPLLLGAWAQDHERRWMGPVLAAASVASFIGIFMAAARTHMVTAAMLALVVSVTGGLSRGQWVRWLAALALVGYVIAGDARLQRFTTLTEEGVLARRIGGSVNQNFFEVAASYPLGNGLTSGGTSVPYFLRPSGGPGMVLESEYARIALEQGLPGLLLWLFFILWVVTRRPGRFRDPWLLGRRLAWVACLSMFASGTLGIGMMASVPQTTLMLLLVGWFTTAPRITDGAGAAATEAPESPEDPALAPLQPVRPLSRRHVTVRNWDLELTDAPERRP